MAGRGTLLDTLGGEAGCNRFSAAFYARVGTDPVLRPLFPGKSLRCATDEFAAFLIQFLGGDEEQTQHRWWLSLRESHARFKISPAQRSAWLKHMDATIASAPLEGADREALRRFFIGSSAYVIGKEAAEPEHEELAGRWKEQRALDDTIAAIASGHDRAALALAPRFVSRPSVFVGVLARMLQSTRPAQIRFAIESLEGQPSLSARAFAGRTLLHFASAAGCLDMVVLLLRLGMSPDILDRGGHTPLYAVANECGSEAGSKIVQALIGAGADVNACGGVTRVTPLHMAARRGFVEIARTLLECGAMIGARDSKGDTPLQRALNCRRAGVAELLRQHGVSRAVG